MATLIDEAKGKLNEHFKETEGRLTQIIDKAIVQPRQAQQGSYASIANTPPPHANPRVAAKEGIKARQFLMEGLKDTKFSHTDIFQLKTELNIILGGLGLKNGKIRSVNKIHNDGTLIEMDSDEATNWLTGQENRNKFCAKLGPEISFRTRAHSLIAYNVPLGLSPEDDGHRQEICEANSMDPNTITTMRWVKPIHRRSKEQRTAHIILTFNNADAANRSITNGIYICNRRCRVERLKREPIRCLKCQGWNHFAKECIEEDDKCGNCTQNHRTEDCPNPQDTKCVSCKVDDHASWSRDCPTFTRKLSEFNERNPENALQYIPTADPWTWTATSSSKTAQHSQPPNPESRQNTGRDRPPQAKRPQVQPRTYDSYVPNYEKAGKRTLGPEDDDRRTPNPTQMFGGYRPITQTYIDTVNEEENPNRPTNPTPVITF
jgi:hypothetical protein